MYMDKYYKDYLYNLNASAGGFMHWDNQLEVV